MRTVMSSGVRAKKQSERDLQTGTLPVGRALVMPSPPAVNLSFALHAGDLWAEKPKGHGRRGNTKRTDEKCFFHREIFFLFSSRNKF